jgi:hypothetical protein
MNTSNLGPFTYPGIGSSLHGWAKPGHQNQSASVWRLLGSQRGLGSSNPVRSTSQSGSGASLNKAAQNRRIRAGLCQRKGTGEAASCDGRGDPSQFLSVERRAGSLQRP